MGSVSGYFKRMSQLAQLSAAPANRSNQPQHSAHSQPTIAVSETTTVPSDGHQPTTMQHVDSPIAEAMQPVDQSELNQRTTYSRPYESNSEPNEPELSHESLTASPTVDSTTSEKLAIGPDSTTEHPRLTEHMNVELQQVSKLTSLPEQIADRKTGLPSTQTQQKHRADVYPTQQKSKTTDLDRTAEPPESRIQHTTPHPSDIHLAVEKTLPTLAGSQNASRQQATDKNTSNTFAVNGIANQQTPAQAELVQPSENHFSHLQQTQSRVPSPAAPPQIQPKVDVKIGSITLTTEPEAPQAQPVITARPKHAPRTNGIWSSGRSFSRAYIRRS